MIPAINNDQFVTRPSFKMLMLQACCKAEGDAVLASGLLFFVVFMDTHDSNRFPLRT